jgi:hypothetical protein
MTFSLDDAAQEAISRNAASMELRESRYLAKNHQVYFKGDVLVGFVKFLEGEEGWTWTSISGGKPEDATIVYLHPTVLEELKKHLRGDIQL